MGYLRPLELQDIWTVNPNRAVDVLSDKLDAAFQRRMERGEKNALLGALFDTFKLEFLLGGVCQLVSALVQVFSPYLTRYLISFATDAYIAQHTHRPPPHVGHGLGFVFGITIMQILQSFCTNQFIYRGMIVGGQTRAVLVSAIFSKALKLSGRAKAGGKPTQAEIEALRSTRDALIESGPGAKENGTKETQKADAKKNGQADSGDSRGWNNGRIITLMSVDADRINTALGMFHMLWTSPISIIVTLVILLVNIGYSCLSGYALLLLSMPLLTMAIRSLVQRRKRINKLTDQRVSLTQEILQAVRFVKFFGWESSFLNRLKEIRRHEIRSIQTLLAIRNAIMCVSMSMPVFASMLSFITYSLSKHNLTPAPIFSSLALFNALRMPLNLLPMVIGQVTDAWTALNRIQEFLLAEERREDIEWVDEMKNAVEVEHASFTWEKVPTDKEADNAEGKKNSKKKGSSAPIAPPPPGSDDDSDPNATRLEPFKLTDMNFEVGRNELIAVIGTVGCGKSSLLSALAGDMRLTEGSVRMGTTRAFCPQYAWIQNATVRNNILFGRDYDEAWYNRVVDACALRADMEMFPNGDQTEIGERGITVSGGQKQRLNIARAIYFNAGLILMDDPLSAVDAHVGKHIMDKAICGILKDRCRILATHQLHVLNRCDRIIVMDEGRIAAVDTFDNLMRDSEVFQRLLASTSQQKSEENQEEGEEDGDEDDKKPVKRKQKSPGLMQQEERATSSVGWSVWKAYISASGSFFNIVLFLGSLALVNGANIMTSLWLSYWTSNKYPYLSTGQYIGIYAGLGGCQVLITFVFSTLTTTFGANASRTMLLRAMTRVLRAPMSFFDTTPMGRITNRFSKDIQVMDTELSDSMRIYSLTITMVISVMVLIIVFFHYVGLSSTLPCSILASAYDSDSSPSPWAHYLYYS